MREIEDGCGHPTGTHSEFLILYLPGERIIVLIPILLGEGNQVMSLFTLSSCANGSHTFKIVHNGKSKKSQW